MGTQYTFDNNGVGSVILTMDNDVTANKDFNNADIDAGRTACECVANNKVGMGTAGNKLFGKVVAVSEELDAAGIPVQVSVQVTGVVRLMYVATTPVIGQEVEVDGAGKVKQATLEASYPAGGHSARGLVIAVDTTATTCDILL